MKYLYLILIFICWGCRAQSPIIPLFQTGYGDVQDAYYKDINNQLNTFTGTWKFTNGNTSLTIILEKKLMQEFTDTNSHFFEDLIVGEYRYIENGVEKINTLPQLSFNPEAYPYSILGNILFGQGDKYLRTGFIDPDRDIPGMEPAMFFERVDSNGIQKLKLLFRPTASAISFDGQPLQYTSFTVPFGEYILVKQ